MADTRVHPAAADESPPSNYSGDHPKEPVTAPLIPPATFVVQFPREQILRYPPPENAAKFQHLSRRGKKGSRCRRCCCYTLCLLLFLVIAAAVSAGVLYLVFRFRSPAYSVTSLSIRGMNATSGGLVSPGFDAAIRAENPNTKVGIYYLRGSSVVVSFAGERLSGGGVPAFYQPRKNVTALRASLTGSDVVLGSAVMRTLRNAQSRKRITFAVRTTVPVKIEVGSIRTWKITVRVKCDVVVDALTETAKILSTNCDYSVRLW